MLFSILNLLLLLSISVLLLALIANKLPQKILAFVISTFFIFEVSSILIGGSLIDYKFYVHFNARDMLAFKGMFTIQIIILFVTLFLIYIFLIWLSRKILEKSWWQKKLYLYAFIGGTITIMCLRGGIIGNIAEIIRIVYISDDASFEIALNNLEMHSYVHSSEVKAEKGKNIIVISLESFEKGYLSDAMAHLTPNLRSLKEGWNYYDMTQTLGSGWTSASLYTYLTGLPSFFKGNGNRVFQKSKNSNIVGVSHVLNIANYDLTYLVGNAEFAGTENLLNAFQIKNVLDRRNFREQYETNDEWGMHDKDLFEEAKQVVARKKNKEPFALFLSSVSTHNPNGIYDERMEKMVSLQNSEIEFMAASVDYMVGDFIQFLDDENMLDNTIVYIFPDHLKMGDASMFNGTGKRGLFLLTNASKNELEFIDKKLYQIDLPRVILEGAEVEHNASFLTNYIEGDVVDFIRDNSTHIASLNSSGLIRDGYWLDNLSIGINEEGNVDVIFNQNKITISSDTTNSLVTTLTFSDEMSFKNIKFISREILDDNNTELTVSFYQQNNQLVAYLNKGIRTPILKSDNAKIEFTMEDVELISILNEYKEQELFIEEDNHPIQVESHPDKTYMQQLVELPYNISEAILELEYSTKGNARPFAILYGQPYSSFTVALHDQIPNSDDKVRIKMPVNKFIEKPALVFRNWSKEGSFIIHSYRLILKGYDNGIRFTKKSEYVSTYSKDRNRFIAHGGGAVNGHTYTNSLEALNHNYANGFKLFELDIIKTSDGKYVAAHDWNHWAKISGYKGSLPVSEEEFLKHKLYNKYTPLDMKAINKWFGDHKDAILVTDKVNEPKEFSQLFLDKKRLMMELFSLEALEEGLKLGIRSAIPSENVVNALGKNKLSKLKELKVKNIAVSRRYIEPNHNLMKELKESGINVYVFHVNFDKGKNEQYVVNYEMDYVYGMYADKWKFN